MTASLSCWVVWPGNARESGLQMKQDWKKRPEQWAVVNLWALSQDPVLCLVPGHSCPWSALSARGTGKLCAKRRDKPWRHLLGTFIKPLIKKLRGQLWFLPSAFCFLSLAAVSHSPLLPCSDLHDRYEQRT